MIDTEPPVYTELPVAGVEPTPDPSPVFEFDDARKFTLYMAQRENHAKGAREAYQRFDQIIVGVSAGSIVLSITFLKDIGHAPDTLGWLLGSWGCFLVASFCALLSLWTSAEQDRESIAQLDKRVEGTREDRTKCERLGTLTKCLNASAFFLMIAGVILLIVFATMNVLEFGGKDWRSKKETVPNPPVQVNVTVFRDGTVKKELASPDDTSPRSPASRSETAEPPGSRKKGTQATPSPRP